MALGAVASRALACDFRAGRPRFDAASDKTLACQALLDFRFKFCFLLPPFVLRTHVLDVILPLFHGQPTRILHRDS
jgi:hypothetical protein